MNQEFALSIVLAKLIGPLLLAVGVGALLNRQFYQSMVADFLKNSGLYYLSGAVALVVGVAIVAHHNIWAADWRTIITVIGWIAVIRGVARLAAPTVGMKLASGLAANANLLTAGAVLIAIVGGILTYFGFLS
ncbi:MAG: hypothetical protein AAFX54_00860 [Pseudomonadota bacterium]